MTVLKWKWDWPWYLTVQSIIMCFAAACASSAVAMDGREFVTQHTWNLHVLLTLLAIPVGTWLGVNIPPPKGYEETNNWPRNVKYVSGYSMGVLAAIYVGQRAADLDWRIIALTFFVSTVGPAVIVIGRALVLKWINNGGNK